MIVGGLSRTRETTNLLELLNISGVLVEVPGDLITLPGLNAFAPEHQLKGWLLAPNPPHGQPQAIAVVVNMSCSAVLPPVPL